MSLIIKLFRRLIGDWWVVRACRWPYPEGYATYNPFRHTMLDSGLTKERAQQICDGMNWGSK